MGQIQNQINQMLGTVAVGAHIASPMVSAAREYKGAKAEASAASKAVGYYGKEAGKTSAEVKQLTEEGKLDAAQETLEEEGYIFDMVQAAEKTEVAAHERMRQQQIKHGGKKERESAYRDISDAPIGETMIENPQDRIQSLYRAIEEKRGVQKAVEERRIAAEEAARAKKEAEEAARAERIALLTQNAPSTYPIKEVIKNGK